MFLPYNMAIVNTPPPPPPPCSSVVCLCIVSQAIWDFASLHSAIHKSRLSVQMPVCTVFQQCIMALIFSRKLKHCTSSALFVIQVRVVLLCIRQKCVFHCFLAKKSEEDHHAASETRTRWAKDWRSFQHLLCHLTTFIVLLSPYPKWAN